MSRHDAATTDATPDAATVPDAPVRVSPFKRLLWLLAVTVQFGLQLATWISLLRREAGRINGPKWFWFLASFVNFIGPAVYLLGGRKTGR